MNNENEFQFTPMRTSPWIRLINEEQARRAAQELENYVRRDVQLTDELRPNPGYRTATEVRTVFHPGATAPQMEIQSDGSWVPAPTPRFVYNSASRTLDPVEWPHRYSVSMPEDSSHPALPNPDYTTPLQPERPIIAQSFIWDESPHYTLDHAALLRAREHLTELGCFPPGYPVNVGSNNYDEYRSPDGRYECRLPVMDLYSGLEPDPDNLQNAERHCQSVVHDPPRHGIHVPHGMRYRHICPDCYTVQYLHPSL